MNKSYFTRRKQHLLTSLVVASASALVYYGQQNGWLSQAGQFAEVSQPGLYSVAEFVDGDTIRVDMNGKTETIRFIGVDTPETHKPNTPVQCYGPDAAKHTKKLIGTSKVRLQSDALSSDRDRYGRLLRYVYLPSGTNIDEQIIKDGFGFAYTYFPFTKSAEFLAAEHQAQATRSGLWSSCHPLSNKYGGYNSNPL